jgi:hypothetical protein
MSTLSTNSRIQGTDHCIGSHSQAEEMPEIGLIGQLQDLVVGLKVCIRHLVPKLSFRLQYSFMVMDPLDSHTPRTSIRRVLRSSEHSKDSGRLTSRVELAE